MHGRLTCFLDVAPFGRNLGMLPIPSSDANKQFPGSGPNTKAVDWSFTTRNGANYDVASFTVRYNYLSPQR